MKTTCMILSAASVVPLLSSCASHQQAADNQLWNIKPVYSVRNSAGTLDGYYRLGRYYQGQRRYEQALDAYREALALDGSFAEAHNGMGVVYAMQGRRQEAIEQLRLAVKLAPDAVHIQNNLGYALYLNKAYAEAVLVLDKAVALEPANQSANANLALALDKQGNKEKALRVLAEAAKLQAAGNAEAQQAQTVAESAPVVSATALPSPAPQPVAAEPKSKPKPLDRAEEPIRTAQVKTRTDEARAHAEVLAQAAPVVNPVRQVSVRTMGPGAVLPKPVANVEGPVQIAQVEIKAYEARAQVVAHVRAAPAAKPVRQAPVRAKGQGTALAQATQKPYPAPGLRVHSVSLASSGVAAQARRAAISTAGFSRIEVSNGNGVMGLARKVAGFLLKDAGSTARLTNQRPFEVAASQVLYRPGYREQAQSLASSLPGRPAIVQDGNLRWDVNVRVLLGKDVAGAVAYFDQGREKVRLAHNEADS